MSFPQYPEYKSSGVEWLGEVPSHWIVTNLKRGYSVTLGKMLQPELSDSSDELLPYLRAANIQWSNVDISDVKLMWISTKERKQLRLEHGDLLVSEGGDVGRSSLWISELNECYFQNSINRVRSKNSNSNKFLYYWISTIKNKGYIDVLCNKSTIAHFTAEKVEAVTVPFPPSEEQIAIAKFLDHETAKIDMLVAEQEKLIEILKSKLDSLVLESFDNLDTKLIRIKNAVEVIERPVIQDDSQIYEPLGLFNRGRGLFHKEKRATADMGDSDFYWIKEGDLILSGQFAWEGSVALAYKEEEGCVVSHRYPVIRGKMNITLTEYLFALLTTDHGNFLLNQSSVGAAGRNRPLNINLLLKEVIPVPNIKTQEKIAGIVVERRNLLREIHEQTKLINERRSALISAAVTGQIDVRNYQPKEVA